MADADVVEHRGLFTAGLAAVAVAVLPPLDGAAERSLTAHMVQHVVLIVVAAPLLAIGTPVPALLRVLPAGMGRQATTAWRRALISRDRYWATWAVAALVVQSAVMWAWHAPVLYEAALHFEPLHGLEHLSYLVTSVVFWWCVGLGSVRQRGGAVPVVFAAALPGSALGAALTLAAGPWYRDYPRMADQQLAGVVMWGFAGLAYVLVAAVLFGLWVRAMERDTPGRPVASGVGS